MLRVVVMTCCDDMKQCDERDDDFTRVFELDAIKGLFWLCGDCGE